MTWDWAVFMANASIPAITASIFFGLLFGATYGWQHGGGALTLWLIVTALTLANAIAVSIAAEVSWERTLGRVVAWTFAVLALPVGRALRLRFESWRDRRRLDHIQRGS